METIHKIPKVAFIDDGINPDIVPESVVFDSFVVEGNEIKKDNPLSVDSHGTRCYEIFRDRVQTPHSLVSIKALNDATQTGTNKALLVALRWCADQDIDLINMSMGTRQFSDFAPIIDAVNCLPHSVIIAACSNVNTITFPACLPTVIGVRHCGLEYLQNTFAYIQNPYDQIDVLTHVKEVIYFDENDQAINMSSGANSAAAPLVTARVCDYLSQGTIGLDAIRQRLKKDAVNYDCTTNYELYKNILPNWEGICIPIIAILGEEFTTVSKIEDLIDVFIQNEYRAIGLSEGNPVNVSKLIFRLGWNGEDEVSLQSLIELYYNFTLPDIMFLHIDLHDLYALPAELQADMLIKPHDIDVSDGYFEESSILNLNESAEHIYQRLVDLLS